MTPPVEWSHLITHLRSAQIARASMRSPGANQQMRDEATVRYGCALDAIFDCLDRLSERGVLSRIGRLLSRGM